MLFCMMQMMRNGVGVSITPEPFYDRSWQVEVVGPINGGIYGNGEYATLVISNFWHQVANLGGQISTDGLNYDYFDSPIETLTSIQSRWI